MIWQENIVTLLPHVSKPIQYVGQELYAVQKAWDETPVRVGLCFPDVYEVGMSHLGLQLLYSILNAQPYVLAERFYTPFADMERLMRKQRIPLFSLESHRSATEFDILGFTLQYELSYSNVLNMLSLADIPLKAADRTARDPLILAGGPCSCNPEPLADFCDAFVIGDGEEVFPQLVRIYHEWKTSGASKPELLKTLCSIPGVYVPSLYKAHYEASGRFVAITPQTPEAPESIQRLVIADLDAVAYFQEPIVPYLKPVHDRLTLEIMRGCGQGCRFCQAGYIYRPLRERAPVQLLQLATTLLARSGYDEISLSSLSTGDYTQLPVLIAALMDTCEQSKVSLSLPSLRVKTLTEDIALAISRVRKTGFTIAPEAGTQRLRNVINKGISEADILQTVEGAFTAGWELLKLYFMVGLPTETEEDLEKIVDLVYQVQRTAQRIARARSHGSRKAQLNVGISSFVPKAHTPFQWERMASTGQLKHTQQMLQQHIRHRAIQLKWHDVNTSYLEGVFARGDRRLGQVLFEAHQLGCRLDGWTEHFDFSKWLKAFEYTQVNPDGYVYREREEHESFPWDHIQTGISRTYLWQERIKGLRAECTPPCTPGCQRCDLCRDGIAVREAKGEGLKAKGQEAQGAGRKAKDEGPEVNENALSPFAFRPSPSSRSKAFRVRAVYSKTGLLRFLSHLDLTRVFQRAISRINVPIAYSQGYHPLPQIAFGPALPVGTEGLREYVDLYFSEEVNVEQFVKMMNATLPQGIKMLEVYPVELQAPSLSSILNQFVFHVFVPESLVEQGYTVQYFTRYIDHFRTQVAYPVQQFRKKSEVIDLKPFIVSLHVQPGEAGFPLIQMGLRTHTALTMKPEEVLHLVCEIPYEQVLDCRFVRVFVGTENQTVASSMEQVVSSR
jgi:radical SAM family uncharacterized protein/radical SAM-linked protein